MADLKNNPQKAAETPKDALASDAGTPEVSEVKDPAPASVTETGVKVEEPAPAAPAAKEPEPSQEVAEEPAPESYAEGLKKILDEYLKPIYEAQEETRARFAAADAREALKNRAEKAGLPVELLELVKDDADLDKLKSVVESFAPQTGTAPASPTSPTLPSLGTGAAPGGEVKTVDELIRAAEANGDREVAASLKVMKLGDVAKNLI